MSNITIITGAGVSVSAGIPTYRDGSPSWSDKEFEKISNASNYGNHLDKLLPKWLDLALNMDAAEPTLFHKELAKKDWSIITQNVDGLHAKAGSDDVLEIHGSMTRWRGLNKNCASRHYTKFLNSDGEFIQKRVRPDMVLFGERLKHLNVALDILRETDIIIYAGTSGNVYPIADWYRRVPYSILVDPSPWGDFNKFYPITTDQWAEQGFPL